MRIREAHGLAEAAVLAVFTCIAVLVGVVFVGSALRNPGLTDFAAFYALGRQVVEHGAGSVYDVALQEQEFTAVGVRYFYPDMYPPALSYLFAPLVVLELRVAFVAWTAMSLIALVAAWAVAATGSQRSRAIQLAAAGSLIPVAFALFHGQVVIPLAAAVAASWWLMDRGHDFAAGLVLSAITLKPQLAFAIPLALLVAGRYRVFAAFAGASTIIVATSALLVGTSGTGTYLGHLRSGLEAPGAFGVASSLSLGGLLRGSMLAPAATVVVLGLLIACVARCRSRGAGADAAVAFGLLSSLLVTPFLHLQDLAVLAVAGWIGLRSLRRRRTLVIVAFWLVVEVASADRLAIIFPLLGLAALAAFALWPRVAEVPPGVTVPA